MKLIKRLWCWLDGHGGCIVLTEIYDSPFPAAKIMECKRCGARFHL